MDYPTNVKIIRVPCTGKVDALYLLKALEDGVDGVYVAGCEEGDCHFLKGNIRAKKRVGYVKSILKDLGINPWRCTPSTAIPPRIPLTIYSRITWARW